MSRSVVSHPCLPDKLIAKLKSEPAIEAEKSYIFQPDFEKFRFDVLKFDPDRRCPVEREIIRNDTAPRIDLPHIDGNAGKLMYNTHHFRAGDRKTFLHSAAQVGDLALAYEIIRMGIDIDRKDAEGVTPLFHALEHIFSLSRMFDFASAPAVVSANPELPHVMTQLAPVRTRLAVITRIAILLVEQHADVNAGAFGYTPLSLATEARQWELVELLLRHGARGITQSTLQSAAPSDKARISLILRNTKAVIPRPARRCPCWSGKLLSDCHGAGKIPYPDYFLCGCGKRKTFGACCGKNGLVVTEIWDPDRRRIKPIHTTMLRFPTVAPELHEYLVAGYNIGHLLLASVGPEMLRNLGERERRGGVLIQLVDDIGRMNDLDPAFEFALCQTHINPSPWDGMMSTLEGRRRMDEWNAAVDEYIRSGDDRRPRFDIELGAKIGSDGRPMYKKCEAEGCHKIEKRDIDKMKCCSACKRIFYCSQECQKRNWMSHKQDCPSKMHESQLSTSQKAIQDAIAMFHVKQGIKWEEYEMSDSDPTAFLDDLDDEELIAFASQL